MYPAGMRTSHPPPWRLNPGDPRAPSQEQWDAMTPEERAGVLAALPSEFPVSEVSPPEGDRHFRSKVRARDVLRRWFDRSGRDVYLGCELPVYYPDERMFAPDIMAVLDVPLHDRDHWTVVEERKGLDLALEIHVHGRRSKDLQRNVRWFAQLGIPEYFVYEVLARRIHGWRLPAPDAEAYEQMVPQAGRFHSTVLGMDLAVQEGQLRFLVANAVLRDSHEVIEDLTRMVDDVTARAEADARRAEEVDRRIQRAERRTAEADRRAEEEARRAEQEARRAEEEARRAEEEARRAEEESRRADDANRRADALERELAALRAQVDDPAQTADPE